jgi:hypothetical protein
MPAVNVTINPGNGLAKASVHIDDTDVTDSSVNPVNLATGPHILRWWAMGSQGATLQVSVTPVGTATPTITVPTTIPDIGMTAGHAPFTA